jgi:nucleotide-binding universal stress UspA family protein
MLKIGTILHPTDFSQYSDYAWHMACALARDYGARLVLLHVKPLPAVIYGEFGTLPPEPYDQVHVLEEKLAQLQPTDPGITVERRLVEGEAASEIIRMAEEEGCDLIVMGNHGRTGISRLLMGSVAEQVVRKAPCPVLTVKSPIREEAAKEPVMAGTAR